MSKYIRTKDGRILEWEKLNEITKLSIDTCEETIKEADTIEELCDRFIIVRNGEGADFWKDFDAMKNYSAYINLNDYDAVYGAIWTNKGLIFVAKMNDKGELELI